MVTNTLAVKDGLVALPPGPGLGVELDPGVFECKDAVVKKTGE